jgi:hypothetical protein
MAARDVVVIGASAGGIEALQRIIGSLPPTFSGAVFITMHFPEHTTSVLPRILARSSALSVMHAVDGEPIVRGRVYVAPPDHHMLPRTRLIRLARGLPENGNRPAIDPMFRSAATAFGPRVVGVVLTGNLDDGTSGLRMIKRRGGVAIVQTPEDAMFPSMPQSAIDHIEGVDYVLPATQIARTLARLAATMLPELPKYLKPVKASDAPPMIDDALETALRALEESASLARLIATKHRRCGSEPLARRFEEQAEAADLRAETVREWIARSHEHRSRIEAVRAPRAVS